MTIETIDQQSAVPVRLSTVTPVYSGEAYLRTLVSELDELRGRWLSENAPVRLEESLFVDDSSIDGSAAVLMELALKHPWVRTIQLSRNYGQHPATIAGILHCSGDWVATLDEDLQHPPAAIQDLLREAVTQSHDIVYAKPERFVHGGLWRDWSSRATKWLLRHLTGNEQIPLFNSFRLIRGSVARAAASVCSHDTYFDIALGWFTQQVGCVKMPLRDLRVNSGQRSGYSMKSLLSHARRMSMSSQAKVLRTAGLLGIGGFVLAVGLALVIIFRQLAVPESIPVLGWASLFVAILFFGGLSAVLASITLEYVANIFLHVQGKPTFFTIDRSADASLATYFQSQDNASPPS